MKTLRTQIRISSELLKVGVTRIKIKPEKAVEVSEAITRDDVKRLIKNGSIYKTPETGTSRGRWRKARLQKKKGRQAGAGSRKGGKLARTPRKEAWINRSRAQRELLKKMLTNKIISKPTFKALYLKIKGGFFRDRKHLKTYLGDHNLVIKK